MRNSERIYLDCGELHAHHNASDARREMGPLRRDKGAEDGPNISTKSFLFSIDSFSIIFTIYYLRCSIIGGRGTALERD